MEYKIWDKVQILYYQWYGYIIDYPDKDGFWSIKLDDGIIIKEIKSNIIPILATSPNATLPVIGDSIVKDFSGTLSMKSVNFNNYNIKMNLLQDLQNEFDELESERDDFRAKLSNITPERDSLRVERDNLSEELIEANDIIAKLEDSAITPDELEKLKAENKKLKDKHKTIFKKYRKKQKVAWRDKAWDNVIIEDILYNKLQLSYKKKMPMLLQWPSGTGKSTMVRALANEHWQDVVEFNFNGDTTVEHLLWHKILVNWDMVWEDWPLTDAVRNGKVFIWHELNSSNAEIQFIFNGLLELDSKGNLWKLSVQWNNWEVITPEPWFRFYWTYNPWYLGTKSFWTSLMSRFIWAEVEPLNVEDEARFLQQIYPKLVTEINLLVELESQLRKDWNFSYDISTRDILQTLMFIEWGFSIEEAIDATVKNSCQIELEKETLDKKLKDLLSKYK